MPRIGMKGERSRGQARVRQGQRDESSPWPEPGTGGLGCRNVRWGPAPEGRGPHRNALSMAHLHSGARTRPARPEADPRGKTRADQYQLVMIKCESY